MASLRWADLVDEDDNSVAAPVLRPLRSQIVSVTHIDLFKTIAIACKPDDTIDYIKAKILEKFGIPQKQQKLIFWGKKLEDGSKTIHLRNIHDGSTVHIADTRVMQIFVRTLTGKTSPSKLSQVSKSRS